MAFTDCLDLIEPNHVPDVFCTGIAKIEFFSGCARVTMYVEHAPVGHNGPPDRVVVARIVWPIEALKDANLTTKKFLLSAPPGAATEERPSVVAH